ncbi:chaplin [Streptomyces spiramyceticus]|uniref:chaplin n=1 Tax=Streptomyces spiramyceticus TaxID=299717 RepID=UPI00237B5E60|nr:chaplin [Streptomyces spiramyceticus]
MRRIAAVALGTAAFLGVLAAPAIADAGSGGAAQNSPGVIAGKTIQIPTHLPVNVCGNSIDIIGLLNPAFGNTCVND